MGDEYEGGASPPPITCVLEKWSCWRAVGEGRRAMLCEVGGVPDIGAGCESANLE